jgi:predicted nuclease of predicted toxin-antitoxin system
VKFLVDMALSPGLAEWLVRHGHQAVHASNIGLAHAPDETVLAQAAAQHRVVVTADPD